MWDLYSLGVYTGWMYLSIFKVIEHIFELCTVQWDWDDDFWEKPDE